jgi:agmatinase
MDALDAGMPGQAGGLFGIESSPDESAIVIIPVPWEATTSYGKGTADGPDAVLQASAQLDMFDPGFGKPYRRGIALLDTDLDIVEWNDKAREPSAQVITAWEETGSAETKAAELNLVNDCSRKIDQRVYDTAKKWLSKGKTVAVLGGDHSSPFGLIKALGERHDSFGILHVDAHMDLRNAYEGFDRSHASIMFNVLKDVPQVTKISAVGIRDFCQEEMNMVQRSEGRSQAFLDHHWALRRTQGETSAKLIQEVIASLPKKVYVSFDIDGLDPVNCPSTGTPVPGGLTYHEGIALLQLLAESGREIIGFDLCEVAPNGRDEWDGNVGARMLYKLCGATLFSRERKLIE